MKPLFAALACVLLLAGCATGVGGYQQPSPDQPHATVKFISTVNSWGWSHPAQTLFYYDNVRCFSGGAPSQLARLYIDTSSNVSARIPAGATAYLRGMTTETWASPAGYNQMAINSDDCRTVASFTPQPGERYDVRHFRSGHECRLEIADSGGRPPPDFTVHPVAEYCGGILVN